MTARPHLPSLPPAVALAAARGRLVVLAAALLTQAGCLFRAAPVAVRYFRPASAAVAAGGSTHRAAESPSGPCSGRSLRMHHVRAGDLLKERMVWRGSDVELGLHEQLRWAEPPAHYVRLALERELYGRQGFRSGSGAETTGLDVELTSFEEVLTAPHSARVGVALTTEGPSGTTLTLEESSPVSSNADSATAVARAIGAALDRLARRAGEQLAQSLCASPATATP